MQGIVVGVGDCRISKDPESHLVTYALGSCIAVCVWDPLARIGGMLHFMLPESRLEGTWVENPYRYADTGTPLLFQSVYAAGGEKKRLVVRLAGGASVVNDGGLFNIGKRNYVAIRRILWKAGVMVQAETVGGSASRTVRLELATGRLWVRGPGEREKELATPEVNGSYAEVHVDRG